MSNTQFIATPYQVGLGRAGSGDEVPAWAHLLDAGQLTRSEAALSFADSAKKVGLAGVLTTSIDTIEMGETSQFGAG